MDLNRTDKLSILASLVHRPLSQYHIHFVPMSERAGHSNKCYASCLNEMVTAAEDVVDYSPINKELLWEALLAARSNIALRYP